MSKRLEGKKVAILVANGFEQSELEEPKKKLEAEGATATIVSPVEGAVKGWQHTDWGDAFPVDLPLSEARADDFDALVLPGGQMNPDNLRIDEAAIRFIGGFVDAEKPIAAICHGPWTLVEADAVRGRRMTSFPSIKTDLENAGASWVDEKVVVDKNFITSRKPDDLGAFTLALVQMLAEGEASSAARAS